MNNYYYIFNKKLRILSIFVTLFCVMLQAEEIKDKQEKNQESTTIIDLLLYTKKPLNLQSTTSTQNNQESIATDSKDSTESTTQEIASQENDGFWKKAKRHFFDTEYYKKRTKAAEDSYEHFMRLLEHDGTYFLYLYSLPPQGIYGHNMRSELKFQLSFKLPIWRGAFWSKGTLFFAYTQTMWFQMFNFEYSTPVRDTDYKPSVFYSYPAEWNLFGGKLKELRLGFLHYSNGIGGDECSRENRNNPNSTCRSRSASNRIMFEAIWESHGFGVHFRVWPYIPERRDNADLANYLGYADLKLYYRHKRHLAEVQIVPIISDFTRYHGSVRLGYSFAINRYISLYGQYFYGYGDSLYEYNIASHRIGIGLRATSF